MDSRTATLLLSMCIGLTFSMTAALSADTPTPTMPVQPKCTWQGQMYGDGERFEPDPCTSCECRDGRAVCNLTRCSPPDCVDFVRDPDHCCPICPNGGNCRTGDGTIIPEGKEVLVDNSMTCRCEDSGFLVGKEAVCTLVGPLPPDGH